MEERVYERLRQLGFSELSETDMESIQFICRDVEQQLLNYCNLRQVPGELEYGLIENACGAFLRRKKTVGGMIQGIDFDSPAIKEITAGDTKTTFATGEGNATPEQRYDALVAYLTDYGRKQWKMFRRMRW